MDYKKFSARAAVSVIGTLVNTLRLETVENGLDDVTRRVPMDDLIGKALTFVFAQSGRDDISEAETGTSHGAGSELSESEMAELRNRVRRALGKEAPKWGGDIDIAGDDLVITVDKPENPFRV